jgi:aminoglycoside 6'-N-acetyltransferase
VADVGFSSLTTARLELRRFRAHQGRGLATEAVRRLLDYLLVERGKHRVEAGCDDRNVRSAALLARVGMRREAHLIERSWCKGEWTSDYGCAVLQREWLASPRPD